MPLLSLRSITKKYTLGGETLKAADDINLDIDAGEFISVSGKSGSGKSTLMNIIGCLDTPDSGSYTLNGSDVFSLKEKPLSRIRRESIGFIFQSYNLLPGLTALENVELPLLYAKVSSNERRELALAALDMVDIRSRAEHLPGQMSGGQQQRVAIARAIAGTPPIILADEPTGNLDETAAATVISILLNLHRSGKTLVLITHDKSIAALAQRKIIIESGKAVEV
jgi:putative ABC transport system ATP-binding protein